MAYPTKGTQHAFFIPNIALATTTSGVLREIDIGATSADAGEYICVRACYVTQLGFALAGEAASGTTTAPTVIFTKRPTPLSATGEAVVGTVTVASGGAIGKVYYENCTPVKFNVGDSMEISHTVGVGTPTGMGLAYWICDESAEVPANNTDMVAG